MGELLDFNVKLSDLQNQYSTVFEGTSEKKRNLDNMEERKIEKRYKSPVLLRLRFSEQNI